MATRTIYLVRHGQYYRLEYDKRTGITVEQANKLDGGLTVVGVEQARLTADRLSLLPVTAIHSSTLPRAVETTEIIAREFCEVPVRKSKMLRECIPCVPAEHAEQFARVFIGDLSPGKKQAEDAYDRYFKRARGNDKHEIVVCHGNLIRYFICRVVQAPPESWMNMRAYNCGISQAVIKSDGRVVLESYNDTGHLPENLKT